MMVLALLLGAMIGLAAGVWWARRSRRTEGRLLSFATHEMLTPLTSVNMTILNFMNGAFGAISKEQEPWMRIIKEQSYWLNTVVGDVRDLVHMRFQKDFRLDPEELDLPAMCEDVLAGLNGTMARAGMSVSFQPQPGLKPVWADHDRVHRMLVNLISHCGKFRSGGPVALSLRNLDRVAGGGGGVELAIEYQGTPASPGEVRRMLEVFYPVEGKNDERLRCVGLGLGMCRSTMEHHGGSLRLEIAPDGNSRISAQFHDRAREHA